MEDIRNFLALSVRTVRRGTFVHEEVEARRTLA